MGKLKGKLKQEVKRTLCMLMAAVTLSSGIEFPVNAAESQEETAEELSFETAGIEAAAEDGMESETETGTAAELLSAISSTEETVPDEITEEITAKETVTEEILADQTMSEEILSEETLAEEIITKETTPEEASSEEVSSEEISKEIITEEASSEEPVSEETEASDEENVETETAAEIVDAQLSDESEEETAFEEKQPESYPVGGFTPQPTDIAYGFMPGDGMWSIDSNGKLTITGTGEFRGDGEDSVHFRWQKYKGQIKTAVIKRKDAKDFSFLFSECENLTSVDLRGCDSSKATSMADMFAGCKNLETIDLSSLNTANVLDMGYMFSGCTKLKNITFGSNFKTSKVTRMSSMFYKCESLAQIDLSRFDTANVTDMSNMFQQCYALTKIDFKKLKTSKVTNMSYMFSDCGFTSYDLSGFDTKNVTSMRNMFNSCKAKMLDLSRFDMSKVTKADEAGGMIVSTELIELKTPYNLKISVPFKNGTWIKDDGTVISELPRNQSKSIHVKQKPELAVEKRKTEYNTGDKLDLSDLTVELVYSKWQYGDKRVKVTGYTTNAAGIDMSTPGTKDLIVSYQGQSAVIKLTVTGRKLEVTKGKTDYFVGSKLETKDLTVIVRYSNGEAGYVSGYTTNAAQIDMSTPGTKNLVVTWEGLTASVAINVLVKEDTYTYTILKVEGINATYYCGQKINWNHVRLYVDENRHAEGGKVYYVNSGYTTNASEIDMNTVGRKTLTVSYKGSVKTVEFTVEPVPLCEEIKFKGRRVFETGEKPDFKDTKLDVYLKGNVSFFTDNFETNIDEIDMSTQGKKRLHITMKDGITADIDIFVIDAFRDDDLKHRMEDNIAYRLDKDGNLTVVGTGNCRYSSSEQLWWQDKCDRSFVKTAKFIMSDAKGLSSLFYDCVFLEKVDLSELDTSSETNMRQMFYNCKALKSLDLGGFDTGNVTDMGRMFSGCSALESLDLGGFNTGNVTNMGLMFEGCSALTSLDLSRFDTGNVTNMNYMFSGCSALKNLDLSSFDTKNVECMIFMFKNCSALTSLDVTRFDTKNVTEMDYMFLNCSRLTSLNLSSFDVQKGTDTSYMLENCSALSSINTPRTANADSMINLPDNGSGTWQSWHDKDGNKYTKLPTGMSTSILLTREKTPKEEESSSSEESSSTEESSSSEESSSIEESSSSEESSSIEESSSSDEEEASSSEESSSTEESSSSGESSSTEESSSSESSSTEESSSSEESSDEEEGSSSEESSSAEESSSSEESSSTEESSSSEESSSEIESSPYANAERADLGQIGGRIASIKARTYDGNAYTPVVNVTVNSNGKKLTLTEGADYSVDYRNNVNAGEGTVIVHGTGIYKGELRSTFTISPQSIKSFKAYANDTTVDDGMSEPVVNIFDGAKRLEIGRDYTLEYDRNLTGTGRKSADVKIVAKGNYKDSKVVKINVYDASTSLFFTSASLEQTEYTYTGRAVKPAVTVKAYSAAGEILRLNKDYKVQYKNNVNAGTAYVIVTGKGQCKGNVIVPFEIKPLKSAGTSLTISSISDKTYNGKLQKPSVTVKCGDKKLVKNRDYTIAYTNNIHVSTNSKRAKVIITGKGNYAGITQTAEFTIKPQKIAKVSVKGTRENLTVTYNKTPLKEGLHYTISSDDTGAKKNKIKVTITGLGDFAGSAVTKTVKLK